MVVNQASKCKNVYSHRIFGDFSADINKQTGYMWSEEKINFWLPIIFIGIQVAFIAGIFIALLMIV